MVIPTADGHLHEAHAELQQPSSNHHLPALGAVAILGDSLRLFSGYIKGLAGIGLHSVSQLVRVDTGLKFALGWFFYRRMIGIVPLAIFLNQPCIKMRIFPFKNCYS